MGRDNRRRSEVKLSIVQLILLTGFCLGCVGASYWLGLYTGTRAGTETVLSGDLAASAKIPITNNEITKDDSNATVSDVYARLDNVTPAASAVPEVKPMGAPEVVAIQKVELPKQKTPEALPTPKPSEDMKHIEAALVDRKAPEPTKALIEDVWAAKASGGTQKATPSEKETFEKETLEAKKALEAKDIDSVKEADSALDNFAAEIPNKVLTPALPKIDEILVDEKKPAPKATLAPRPTPTLEAETTLEAKTTHEDSSNGAVKAPSKGWYAQVAAPKELKDAENLGNKLRRSGFPVMIEHANVRGETYYRVLVGPESNTEHADRLVQQLKRESYIQSEPFIKMVVPVQHN